METVQKTDQQLEFVTELQGILKVGEKYTLYKIDSMMAMSHRTEFFVRPDQHKDGIVFTAKGKRKKFVMRFWESSGCYSPKTPARFAIFAGWDQPFKVDTDQRSGLMRGNACLNIMGTVEAIRAWWESGQLNPYCDKVKVVAIGDGPEPSETPVFPEEFHGQHAIIGNLLAKQA